MGRVLERLAHEDEVRYSAGRRDLGVIMEFPIRPAGPDEEDSEHVRVESDQEP